MRQNVNIHSERISYHCLSLLSSTDLVNLFFKTGFFSRYLTHGNPFDDVYVEDEVEDVLAENGVSSAIL